jgi:hypothetical protein
MSNTSEHITTTISSEIIQALIVLPIMEKYIIVLLYIFGFIGSLLNIFTFLQKQFRTKSCSTYFVASSITDFCYINSFMLIQLIDEFNSKIFSSINSTDIWCKMGNYFYFLLPCLASTYITFASIDRFCASSSNNHFQKFNQVKISCILTLIIFLIWSLFSLHIPISYNLIRLKSVQCSPPSNVATIFVIIDGYFFALFNGLIVPFILMIFGLLIFRNVQLIHRRIIPQINRHLTRTNQHLITMLLFQVILTIILHIPFIVLYLYGIYNPVPSDTLPLLFDEIFSYIGRWFWFMNFSKAFYVNILSSQTFRRIFKGKIIHIFNQQILSHRSTPVTIIPHRATPVTIIPLQSPSSVNSDLDYTTRIQNQAVTVN